jgi:glycosyltransferase involved in cell wall biosynthesis
VQFRVLETTIFRWRIFGPWSFELFGGLRLLFHCMRHRPDLIYARQDLYTLAPALAAKLLRIPLVCEVNSSIPEEIAVHARPAARRIVSFCERFTLSRAAAILVLAPEHGRALASRVGVKEERILTVPIGAHLPAQSDPMRTRIEHGIDPETFLVGFAGNLAPIQGVDLLVDAFQKIHGSDIALWILGTGIEEGQLRRRAAASGVRIRFFGGVSREESDRLQQACQILVAPYRREAYLRASAGGALSSKVLAYLANDRPILITSLPSYSWLEKIGAGELCVTDDPGEFAAAITGWQRRWHAAGRPLIGWPFSDVGPGRRFVESGRTWNDTAARTESVLLELIRGE